MKMSIRAAILSLFLFLFLIPGGAFSQETWWKEKKFKTEEGKKKYELCRKTFKEIANGFTFASTGMISKYFNGEVFLDVIGNEKGYYSTGQSEYIISDFIDYFKVTGVKLLNSYYKNSYAFVTGRYWYNIGAGKRELKLSISLKYSNDSWYIEQININ